MMVKYEAYDGEDLKSKWMPLGKNQGNERLFVKGRILDVEK
jgi:hypothetical protein